MIVNKYAIGSLLPLSNSSNGFICSFRETPLDRKIPNTEAESVDDITDASNSASSSVRVTVLKKLLVIQKIKKMLEAADNYYKD
ncbi:hypothetical protein FACS1894174_07090 [Bacteroidia bacterium]|nr:hypothetical protein FACS1894174_07090 [Bacteroidia bacterium]